MYSNFIRCESIFVSDTDYAIFTNHNNYLITNHIYCGNHEKYGNVYVILPHFEKKKKIQSGSILSKKTGTYLSSKCVQRARGKNAARLKKM